MPAVPFNTSYSFLNICIYRSVVLVRRAAVRSTLEKNLSWPAYRTKAVVSLIVFHPGDSVVNHGECRRRLLSLNDSCQGLLGK